MGRADGGTTVTTMYRSVPPRPLSYTFSDILQASLEVRTPGRAGGVWRAAPARRSKTAPVSTNAPEEYAERFKSRPTTRPAVIDFDGAGVKMYSGSGGASRRFNKPGFPAIRTSKVNAHAHMHADSTRVRTPEPLTERGTTSTTSLHLAPMDRPPLQLPPPSTAGYPQSSPSQPPRLFLTTPPHHFTGAPPVLPPHPLHMDWLGPGGSKPRTPEQARLYGLQSSTPSLPSRGGKVSRGSAAHHHHIHQEPAAATSGPHHSMAETSPGEQQQWQELSSSKLTTLDTVGLDASPGRGGVAALEELTGTGFPEVLAHSEEYDDLTDLPRPKRILPRRDLPWVFRFKVKKEMIALSKIMASRPATGSGGGSGSMGGTTARPAV